MSRTRPSPLLPRSPRKRPSARHRAASRRNLEKAWEANRTHWEKTPARMANAHRTIQLAQAALRGRPRKFSPAQLAAARANIAKARAVLNARGRSPQHLSKLRETIKKARAARTPEGFRRHSPKVLKHGLYARSVRDTMRPLGEDTKEFATHLRLLREFFGPQDEREGKIVAALAEAIRRRLRLWRAEAHWQARYLGQCLGEAVPLASPDPDQTLYRSWLLLGAVMSQDRLFERDRRLVAALERVLRQLVRKRSDGRLDLKAFSREARRPKDEATLELERIRRDSRVWERLREGGPEVEAILERFRADRLGK